MLKEEQEGGEGAKRNFKRKHKTWFVPPRTTSTRYDLVGVITALVQNR